MASHVVISYARADQNVVRVVVQELRAAAGIRRFVYWDEDFEPGREWAAQFRKEVVRTRKVFVFWCAHSALSRHVRNEYKFALKQQKPVVPVLLDDTRLPRALAPLHGIDGRRVYKHRKPTARKAAKKAAKMGRKYYGTRPRVAGPRPLPPPKLSAKRRRLLVELFRPFL